MKHAPLAQSLAEAMANPVPAATDVRKLAIKSELERCIKLVDEGRLAAIIVAERSAPDSKEISVTPHGVLTTALQAAAYLLKSYLHRSQPSEPNPRRQPG